MTLCILWNKCQYMILNFTKWARLCASESARVCGWHDRKTKYRAPNALAFHRPWPRGCESNALFFWSSPHHCARRDLVDWGRFAYCCDHMHTHTATMHIGGRVRCFVCCDVTCVIPFSVITRYFRPFSVCKIYFAANSCCYTSSNFRLFCRVIITVRRIFHFFDVPVWPHSSMATSGNAIRRNAVKIFRL